MLGTFRNTSKAQRNQAPLRPYLNKSEWVPVLSISSSNSSSCHDGVRTICDSHRFLTRDIFLRKNSQKVCLLRKYSYLCGVVRHYVKLKNFRLWETQNNKKLKIVLNFQDCLVVSNFLSTFANEYET